MDKLPAEILPLICRQVPPEDRASLATVSQCFARAVSESWHLEIRELGLPAEEGNPLQHLREAKQRWAEAFNHLSGSAKEILETKLTPGQLAAELSAIEGWDDRAQGPMQLRPMEHCTVVCFNESGFAHLFHCGNAGLLEKKWSGPAEAMQQWMDVQDAALSEFVL